MIQTLAKMLGLSVERAEATMHSECAARSVLTRRNLFAAGAALATGSAFSFASAAPFTYYEYNEWILRFGELLAMAPRLNETEKAFKMRMARKLASPVCHRVPDRGRAIAELVMS